MGKDRQEKNSKLQAESNQTATSPFTMTERQALNKTEDSKAKIIIQKPKPHMVLGFYHYRTL